ncbi:DUF2189 domain-containing protein [Thiomicrorhabdus heinhorstiae]|uniref:DUF2189 domain-containing protein n=1 Tax=Thiomicrorhabdus heinhorstiae TaxID=2748010 RepID=A0ABS0C3G1_9GAMM|nr:DUF2189 domain-containing protein [Thiomicrorhabdus heinhorstiae]MBF6058802.1 DUF2189 domain-containing protein [Thiomicrorhabdus heinhorstiae]
MADSIVRDIHAHDHYTVSGEHLISHDVSVAQIGKWLKLGWMDMARAPLASVFYGLLMTVTVLGVLLAYKQTPFLMFMIATSFVMIAPFLATGLYHIAHQLEKNQRPSLLSSLVVWRHNLTEFALFAFTLGAIIAIWSRIVPLIAGVVVGTQSLLIVDADQGVMGFLFSEAGIGFMIAFFVIGAIVAGFVFAISVVTIPLLLKDDNIGVLSAMVLSAQVTMENKGVMAVWALVIGTMVMAGIATLGFGMIVVMPLLAFASWHAFNDLIEVDGKTWL